MNFTAEINTSIRQGSMFFPVILHNSLYIEYGFRPISSNGLLMPIMFRYRIVAGPTFGMLMKSCTSVLVFILSRSAEFIWVYAAQKRASLGHSFCYCCGIRNYHRLLVGEYTILPHFILV